MAPARILSVGYPVPGGEIETLDYDLRRSLLDADIIIFAPGLPYSFATTTHQNKELFNDYGSFQVREALAHWRSELNEAVEAGKLVVVHLRAPREAYVHTGEKRTSGTGRNQQVTNIVNLVSSYDALPFNLECRARKGTEIIREGALPAFSRYWSLCAEYSTYEVTISGRFSATLLKARTGNTIVGAALLGKHGGTVLLVPPLEDGEDFTAQDEEGDAVWSDKAVTFGKSLVDALVSIAASFRSGSQTTPTPEWAQANDYRLPAEDELRTQIQACSTDMKRLQERRSELEGELRRAGLPRVLLYGTGKELERAVIEALKVLGFDAGPFAEGHSSFDILFTSEEGRFLGEAEGKDKAPIKTEKLDQLERNVREDFQREGVDDYAKGVLFGNTERLVPPDKRAEQAFSDKCLKGAERTRFALVRTMELFRPVSYLLGTADPEYAARCRRAIAETEGAVVVFPDPPAKEERQIETVEGESQGAN